MIMNEPLVITTPCRQCGFIHNCYCATIPAINSDLMVTLLTHPNELSRSTNTGKIVKRLLPCTHIEPWERKAPPPEYMTSGKTPVLVFPSPSSIPLAEWQQQHPEPSHFIVLDATWQEAKKMLNRSQWLQTLPQVCIEAAEASQYQLRRNQQSGNLCTFEVVTQLVHEVESKNTAQDMRVFFGDYLQRYQAERCGHAR